MVAAKYLNRRGYNIVEQNWRTRWCEIDIIASKNDTIYFVEVKYRSNTRHGGGLEYITQRKLQQMHFAAELWLNSQQSNDDYRLAAVELTGPECAVTAWVDDVS